MDLKGGLRVSFRKHWLIWLLHLHREFGIPFQNSRTGESLPLRSEEDRSVVKSMISESDTGPALDITSVADVQ